MDSGRQSEDSDNGQPEQLRQVLTCCQPSFPGDWYVMRLRVLLSLLLLLVVSTALNAQVAFSKRSYQAIGQRPIVTDINGDGYPDVIALGGPNGFDNNLHLMLNHRDGTFESPAIDMSTDLLTFAIADLNRDGRPDF